MFLAKVRIVGIHLLILGVVGVSATAASLSFGRMPERPRARHFPVLPVRIKQGGIVGPISLAMAGMPADAGVRSPRRRSAAIHAIVLSPGKVVVRAGGEIVRAFTVPRRSPSLAGLVRLIANHSWITQPEPGVIYLRAALIVTAGASLTVGRPVTRFVLANRPGVFLGADHAALLIKSVTVESTTLRYAGSYRPFILAERGSHLRITRARLIGLGWDWSDSYGVAWKDGATGGATRSTFSNNYFGLYMGGVSGLDFTNDTVTNNYFYGFDPHTYSRNLAIRKNTVTGNGRHGIIFSGHVTDSIVADNTVRGNAANGIMMDDVSTGNLIQGNIVAGNHGDGIVLASSPDNRIVGNVVRGNREGVRLTRTGPRRVRLAGNVVTANSRNTEGILNAGGNSIASDTRLAWNGDCLAVIWTLAGVLVTVALMSLTFGLRGRDTR